MAQKTTKLKFNHERKEISGSLGFACECSPVMCYLYYTYECMKSLTTSCVMAAFLYVFSRYLISLPPTMKFKSVSGWANPAF